MAEALKVKFTRNVMAGGTPRVPGEVAALPALDAFTICVECNAGEFVHDGDRERAAEARRRENARVLGPARSGGSPWRPIGG